MSDALRRPTQAKKDGAMIDISMTTFVDFVAATGPSRLTVARNAKQSYEKGYDPRTDYWRLLRRAIAKAVENGYDRKTLEGQLDDVTDPKKLANYRDCASAFNAWARKQRLSTMKPRKKSWSSGELEVAVNPELCGEIGGQAHAIKLYLRGEPLSKARSDVALALLQESFGKKTTVGVLDVKRSKLFVPTREIADLDALLHGEAAALVGIWERLPSGK
jgi:hypothetical protein